MADLPSVRQYIQVEESTTRFAISESVTQKVGGSINWILDNVQSAGIGDVEMSLLTEAQFQATRGVGWVLMDGRNVTGSAYATLTGNNNIPDMRGRYPRMKDHGAGVDSNGDLATGSTYADQNKSHTHQLAWYNFGGGPFTGLLRGNGTAVGVPSETTTGASGGSESHPKTIVINFFVRID